MIGWPGARPGMGPCTEAVLVRAKSRSGVRTTAVAVLLLVFSQSTGPSRLMTTVLVKDVPGIGGIWLTGSMRSTETWAVKGPALPARAPASRATWFTGIVGGGRTVVQPV